jgi:large subunit ribosomal protein L1
MAKKGKRYNQALEKVNGDEAVSLTDAVALLAQQPKAKFRESVDLSFKLGVDPRHSDQMVRGTVDLPHGTGKKRRIIVFCQPGPAADAAKQAGAEEVGYDDLLKKVGGGWTNFDVAVATPEAMGEVRKLGRVLGPRGLMPNPKTGTVTDDVASAVGAAQGGRVEFKIDKTANLHVLVGKADFEAAHLEENARTAIDAITKARPSSAKGVYIKSCTISTTMGPGVKVNVKESQTGA